MSENSVVIAVAGAGKTEFVAERIANEPNLDRTMLLTYLTRNQVEGSARVAEKIRMSSEYPRVMGWFSFLLNEIARPYSKLCWPEIDVGTLCTQIPNNFQYLQGDLRYFTTRGDVFSERLALVAVKVIDGSKGAAIRRLESIVDAIYIDEAQDLRGNDLVVLERLMRSKIRVTVVCDPRQSVISTSRSDTKYKQYRNEGIADFFLAMEKAGNCKVHWKNETHRFIPHIAKFSDAVIACARKFPPTVSNVAPNGYSGLYLIDKKDIEKYAWAHHATVLRINKTAGSFDGVEVANFGECKA
ncbi:hypothetical protein ACUYFE_01225 [Olegusella massiliensis]|uniref:hypothetical protein n=1 Tax=Olegusella massiliensis TaxID=1776381 RepID=UPI004055562F